MRFNVFASIRHRPKAKTGTMRENAIIELARREVTLEHAMEFDPIVRGPVFAVVAMTALLIASMPYMAYQKARALLAARESGAEPPGV
jgi:hypothetical protein